MTLATWIRIVCAIFALFFLGIIIWRRNHNFKENIESAIVDPADMIEYALMAGFVAVAMGAIIPGTAESLKNMFGTIQAVLNKAAAQ